MDDTQRQKDMAAAERASMAQFKGSKEFKKCTNSVNEIIKEGKENFRRKHPCMYYNDLCEMCLKKNECDMRTGRELHLQYFLSGWCCANIIATGVLMRK